MSRSIAALGLFVVMVSVIVLVIVLAPPAAVMAADQAPSTHSAALALKPSPPRFDADDAAELERLERQWEFFVKDGGAGRNCLTAKGEEIGWLMSPPLNAYYYGFLATRDSTWIERSIACTDAWLRRGVAEPDGFIGWPKFGAAGNPTDQLDGYYAYSLLGEAMALRPIVLMSAEILRDPGLRARYGDKARRYIEIAQGLYDKWDKRGSWRSVDGGAVAVVLPYGIDPSTGKWTENYQKRFDRTIGFSLQDNKQNLVALWMLAMHDATGDAKYRDKAALWFAVMKARMQPNARDTFKIWNYWQPAGPWDYRADGKPKHWVGVHPNAGYYSVDVEAISTAYRHKIVFDHADMARLIRTASAEGRFWWALAPFDDDVKRRLFDSLDPTSWEGLQLVPWYVALRRAPRQDGQP